MMRLIFALGALAAAVAPGGAETFAIVNARAVTLTPAGTIEGATVVVRDGRIAAVGAGVPAPPGARVLDARGRYVTPGLMNAFTRLGLVEVGSVAEVTDHAATSGPVGAAFDVQYGLNPNSTLLPLARADGLTRALVAPSASPVVPFAGIGAVIRLRPGPDVLDRAGAAEFAAVGGATAAAAGGSRAVQWVLLRNALREAGRARDKPLAAAATPGRDLLLGRLDAEALAPVLGGRMPLAILAERESDIRQAARMADDFGIGVVIVGGAEAWRAADLLAARKVPVVLDPLADMPMSFDQMGARLENAALLHRAGVRIAFYAPGIHMSHNAGLAIRESAGVAVAHGLPWAAALAALTVNPARIWGVAERYGTLEPGRDADVVVWSGDPLEVTSAPDVVLIAGEEVSLETRQTALRDRYHPRRNP